MKQMKQPGLNESFKEKYGHTALIAGASEGLGAAYAHALAARGLNVVLVARRKELLEERAREIKKQYDVQVSTIVCDLSNADAVKQIQGTIGNTEIGVVVYNAALSPIGSFLKMAEEDLLKVATLNMLTPMMMVKAFGKSMAEKEKGAIILMTSLAGFQGSGFLAMYSATKAFNRMLAESLWYEWKNSGVDIIACCAGATLTPGYLQSHPQKTSMLAPKVQQPQEVVEECLMKLGKIPSFISGNGNKIASFFMNKFFSRKSAVNMMGNTIRKMYRIED
jgi:short-subunit dehydrogenase